MTTQWHVVHRGASPAQVSELRAVDRALTKAAPAERFAWVLRYVEGCSLEEVAASCECSLATAKRRLSRAQEVVQRTLGEGTHG